MRIGFIGLGAMGAPMAEKLVRAGFTVTGFDLRPEAGAALAAVGGTAASAARDAVAEADIVLLMVVSGAQADAILLGRDGIIDAIPRDAIVIASCTQPPEAACRLGSRLAEHGIAMLDAPVSGGVAGARDAALTVMASGPREAYDRALPALQAVGKNLFYLGEEHGKGSTAKLINQHLCGIHIAAAAEALNLAEHAGLPLDEVHRMVSVSAGNSWMWGNRGPRMLQTNPEVTSAVDIFIKDLSIVLDHGREARHALPLAAVAQQMFLAAAALGLGRHDDSQVIAAYRALNGGTE